MLYSNSRPIEEAALPLSRHGHGSARVLRVAPANILPEALRLTA
jgi:hypothetical protein